MTETVAPLDESGTVAQSLYEAPVWGLLSTISWIGFRTNGHLTAISSRDSLRGLKIYPTLAPAPAMVDITPDRTLLEAIQTGILQAVKDGELLPSEAWFGKDIWDHGEVYFRREAVLKLWPSGPMQPLVNQEILETGLPGRPTKSRHLIENECRRRWSNGERHSKTVEWAQLLIDWLRQTHPNAKPPSLKTTKNNLASWLRELRRSSSE